MAHLLSFMRIPPHTGPSSDLLQPVHLLEQVLRQKLQKESRTLVLRTPSLLAMTHVANIISYMVRRYSYTVSWLYCATLLLHCAEWY